MGKMKKIEGEGKIWKLLYNKYFIDGPTPWEYLFHLKNSKANIYSV